MHAVQYSFREIRPKSSSCQSTWIEQIGWVAIGICERINAALKSDRIALDVPPEARVVVAEVVVGVAGLVVGVLAGEAQRHGCRTGDEELHAEGLELAVPHNGLRGVGHLLRRAQMVGVDVTEGAGLDRGQR